jgi:DNA-binding beta-propeller fold protein YncE
MTLGRGTYARALTTTLALGAALLISANAAAAEQTHIFDATLSLTGGCMVTPEDPVADPGEPTCEEAAHPPQPFVSPRSVATDSEGNIYVPSAGTGFGIDVFDPRGYFLTEISDPGLEQVELEDIAIDTAGRIYVYGFGSGGAVILRLDPASEHDPAAGVIAYEPSVVVLDSSDDLNLSLQLNSIAVDSTGRLYVDLYTHINIYKSAEEGNVFVDSISSGLNQSKWVTVDSTTGEIYASSFESGASVIKVFGGAPGHPLLRTISGFSAASISVAVDEATGRVFVGDLSVRKKVYVFSESEEDQTLADSISTVEHQFVLPFYARVVFDNHGSAIPGKERQRGYLFVPSLSKGEHPPDHVYAFAPLEISPPDVVAVDAINITGTEAELEANIISGSAETVYRFQYVTRNQFERGLFTEAAVAGEGRLQPGKLPSPVRASLTGLIPGTVYYVRVVAESSCDADGCSDEAQSTLRTFSAPAPPSQCSNAMMRIGPSAHLPDCRAYELVTPPDTGGRPPQSIGVSSGDLFGSPSVTAAGSSVSFIIGAGGLPGLGGSGGFFGDGYLAERLEDGWHTRLVGLSGAQAGTPEAGGLSPDHTFSAWVASGFGFGELELAVGGTRYIRYPDGSFQLVGRGSLGVDLQARVRRITERGAHIIFEAETQLEPQAPVTGTTLYDRTIDPASGAELTHVVSLLPGELTPEAGKAATYEGSSEDGTAVAFKLGHPATSPLYVRVDNAMTLVASAAPAAEFAGLSSDGRYLFYDRGGDLFRFDSTDGDTDSIAIGHKALFVNVSADGSHAYFVSTDAVTGDEANSHGDQAVIGEQNLYVWDGSGNRFIGTVTERDVFGTGVNVRLDGLGLWSFALTGEKAVTTGETAKSPSRTTPDGSIFLFKSRASLTGFQTDGHAQIYRYAASSGQLRCLSCSPTNSAPTGDATLQTVGIEFLDPGPTKTFAQVQNVNPSGDRVFFESPEPLVLEDTDRLLDVYEWEESGVGSCQQAGGCLYLISSGHSSRPEYLYGASSSGDDVFFTSADLLVGADKDATPSIYDARVGGGFAEAPLEDCVGEGCRPTLAPAPPMPAAGTGPSGNVAAKKARRCGKGKRKVKRGNKKRCVVKHRKAGKKRHQKRRHTGGRR